MAKFPVDTQVERLERKVFEITWKLDVARAALAREQMYARMRKDPDAINRCLTALHIIADSDEAKIAEGITIKTYTYTDKEST